MNIDQILRMNETAVRQLWQNLDSDEKRANAYFGFLTVDAYECPPFVMFSANDGGGFFSDGYEPMSMQIWCRLARDATGIFDIGSHAGLYSLSAAALRPELPIQAFEPNPYAFARLRLNKSINGFWHIVENRFALAHKNGFTNFSWYRKPNLPIASGGGIVAEDDPKRDKIVVEMRNLDSLEAAQSIGNRGLIKIDVEGGERVVFAGMSSVLTQEPDMLLETFSEESCRELNALLLPMGYRAYAVKEEERCLVPRPNGLEPANVTETAFNQFLTTRPEAEIATLFKVGE